MPANKAQIDKVIGAFKLYQKQGRTAKRKPKEGHETDRSRTTKADNRS